MKLSVRRKNQLCSTWNIIEEGRLALRVRFFDMILLPEKRAKTRLFGQFREIRISFARVFGALRKHVPRGTSLRSWPTEHVRKRRPGGDPCQTARQIESDISS
jgi:hypothetical protein